MRPDDFYQQDAERWMRVRFDQDAFREGVGIARAEAEKVKERAAASAEAQQPPARRRRTT